MIIFFFVTVKERSDEEVNITIEDDNTNTSVDNIGKMATNSPSFKVLEEISQIPIVYTRRLEDMSVFLQDFSHLSLKEIHELIERESTPLFENLIKQTVDLELRSLFYKNMLEKLESYNNDNGIKLNEEEIPIIEVDTDNVSKVDSNNCTQKQNRKNDNTKRAYVVQISSDDDDDHNVNNLNELFRISMRNRSLLDLCKPVKVVLEDIGKMLTDKQISKPKYVEQKSRQHKKNSMKSAPLTSTEQSTINRELVYSRFVRIAPKPVPPNKFSSINNALAPLQPVSSPTSFIPTFPSKIRIQSKLNLLPPLGFTWNPSGGYVVFHDLCTKETEAHFVDVSGHPIEYYKFDHKSSKKLEKFITSQKCMKLDSCCWYKREAYIHCLYIPEQTALLFRKPHECPFYKCTCCCKCLISELNDAPGLNQDLSVIEPQVTSLHPDRTEDILIHTEEKPDYLQELLSKCTDSVSLINRALRFDRNEQLKQVGHTPTTTKAYHPRSFEIERGSNIINRFQNSTKISIKNTINGSNEIYVKDLIEKVILHTVDVENSIPESSALVANQGIENICCWYKLQSLCDALILPLSFSTAEHSCPLLNCCCCCKPESKIDKPSFVGVHPPTRVRHSMLHCSEFELKEMSKSGNFTCVSKEATNPIQQFKLLPETSKGKQTTNSTNIGKILNKKSTGLEEKTFSCRPRMNKMFSVKDYIDKVIVDSLNGPHAKRGRPHKEVNSKNPPNALHAESPAEASIEVSTSVSAPTFAELSEQHQITDVYSTSTPIITGVFGNSSIQTTDPTTYPIITNVFSVPRQTADVPNATTPIITSVFSQSPQTDTSFSSDLRATASKGLPQASNVGSQEKIVESVISTVLETFKNVRLTINDDGKVAAALGTPVHKLSTAELKILGNILSHAQSQVETLGLRPGTNINNSINQLPFATPINIMNSSSSGNIQKVSSQSTQTFTGAPSTAVGSIWQNLSAEMDKKVMDYARSYQSFIKLKRQKERQKRSTLRNVRSTKRKMKQKNTVQPRIRVISPTRLGAPSAGSSMNECAMEDEETDELSKELAIISADFENQLLSYSIPVTENTPLQFAPILMQTECAVEDESFKIEVEIEDEVVL